jgi:tetratricopeptide (TPR) repeat protein
MAEVAPLVLSSGLSRPPPPTSLSWCLELVLRALLKENEYGQLSAARRTLVASEPLLTLGESPQYRGRVRPSVAHLRYVMGALELQGGHPELAQPLLEAASRLEPTSDTFFSLAAIHRQRGDDALALKALGQAEQIAQKVNQVADRAEAMITMFEIHRDRGRALPAARGLSEALRLALDARQLARSDVEQARAERLLARVLAHYRDYDGARRATERAYEASRSQSRQLAATVLDAARRALTYGDLAAARLAVREAVEGDLSDDDIVYVALWLHLLELRLGVPSDGTLEMALSAVRHVVGWPASLRDWAAGKLTSEELAAAALDRVQRTEAVFYSAMRSWTKSKDPTALSGLEQVARSEAVELVEVSIARDLLLERAGRQLTPDLPLGVKIP